MSPSQQPKQFPFPKHYQDPRLPHWLPPPLRCYGMPGGFKLGILKKLRFPPYPLRRDGGSGFLLGSKRLLYPPPLPVVRLPVVRVLRFEFK